MPQLTRVYDATKINEVVNDPSVYPWVHGPVVGEMDLTPIIDNRHNICLMGEHGGFLYLALLPGLYEIHSQVLPSGRGQWAASAAMESLEYMFTRTDAVELLTRVPHGNIGAKALARKSGLRFMFSRPKSWVMDHGLVDSDIYSITIQDWVNSAPGMVEKGQWFHRRLEEEYRNMGSQHHVHDEDFNHDRHVGVAVSMILGGQANKGMVFYNRWARMAGYHPISVVSENPTIVDIQESVLLIKDDDLRIMACR